MSERRIASLDLLRGVAALSVTIPHFFIFQYPGGQLAETISILGVEVFFVLSGYVLAPQIIFFSVERPDIHNLGIFLVRRWMRTIPPYLIALLVISFMSHALLTADFLRYAVYVQNFFRQSNANDYFSVAWSLSVEEWFYLLFPPFVIATLAMAGRSIRSVVIAGILFVLLISLLRQGLGDYTQWGPEVRRVVIVRMDAIAWGFLLNVALTRTSILDRIPLWSIAAAAVALLALAIGLTMAIADNSNRTIEGLFPFYASAFGGSAIVLAVKSREWLAASPAMTAISDWLGRLSYSMYLFHIIVLQALAAVFSGLGWPLGLAIYLALTFVVAGLMYSAVEAPVLAQRPRFRQHPDQAQAALQPHSTTD